MPGFEQNEGTNLKLKSASRLEAERSEILNSGSTLTDVTQHFASFFRESGHKLKTEKCTSFQDGEIRKSEERE